MNIQQKSFKGIFSKGNSLYESKIAFKEGRIWLSILLKSLCTQSEREICCEIMGDFMFKENSGG